MNKPLPKTNTLAVVSFVLSIIFFFIPILMIISSVMGIIALTQIKKNHQKGKGLAIVAIIMPLIYIIFISALAFFGVLNPQPYLPQ